MDQEQSQKFRPLNNMACPIEQEHAAKPAHHPANVRLRSSLTSPPIIEGINPPFHKAVILGIYAPVILPFNIQSTIPIAASALDLRSQQIGEHGVRPVVQGWTTIATSALDLCSQQERGVRPVVQGWTRHHREGTYWSCQWKLVKQGWVQGVTQRRNGYKERKRTGPGKGKNQPTTKREVFCPRVH